MYVWIDYHGVGWKDGRGREANQMDFKLEADVVPPEPEMRWISYSPTSDGRPGRGSGVLSSVVDITDNQGIRDTSDAEHKEQEWSN